jgi:hypothetical protein
VLYQGCHVVDQSRVNDFVRLFHPEETFTITWEENGKDSGHEEIRKWIVNDYKTLSSLIKYLRHKITCQVIDVCKKNAAAYSYLDVEAAPSQREWTGYNHSRPF